MIKFKLAALAFLTGLLGCTATWAADTWTSTTGVLNAPIVKYSDSRFLYYLRLISHLILTLFSLNDPLVLARF